MKAKMDKPAIVVIRPMIAPLGLGDSGESALKNAVVASKHVLVGCPLLIIVEGLAKMSQRRIIKTATPKGAQSIAELAAGLVGDSATKHVAVAIKPDLEPSRLSP
jgi:hypothetical protein